MEPISTEPFSSLDVEHGEQTEEEHLVRQWRVEQLRRLGLPPLLAEGSAHLVDWHELAKLVALGCPAELALDIVR